MRRGWHLITEASRHDLEHLRWHRTHFSVGGGGPGAGGAVFRRAAWRQSCIVSDSRCRALATVLRCIHMPLGGFEEDLPLSLGRPRGKGKLSNVNLRVKHQESKLRKTRRKKLLTPTVSPDSETDSVAQIKEGLLRLIARNKRYSQRRPAETAGEVKLSVANTSVELAGALVTKSVEREDTHRIVRGVIGDAETEDTDSARFSTTDPYTRRCSPTPPPSLRTMLEESVDEVPKGTQSLVEVSRLATSMLPMGKGEEEDSWQRELNIEKYFRVTPGSTIFGSDLDRLERDMMIDYQQRGKALPPIDDVFSKFGSSRQARRMLWEPSSSFDHLPCEPSGRLRSEAMVGSTSNRNVSAYHMQAEAYREAHEDATKGLSARAKYRGGINDCLAETETSEEGGTSDAAEVLEEGRAAEENPHFPVFPHHMDDNENSEKTAEHGTVTHAAGRVVVVNAKEDYKAHLIVGASETGGSDIPFDAYRQRASESRLLELRGVEYWNDYGNRRRLDERGLHRAEAFEQEKLQEGAMDTSEVEYSTNRIRKETLLYFQAHPINEMIQESFVRIRQILPRDGSVGTLFNPYDADNDERRGDSAESDESCAFRMMQMDVDIPVQEARQLAKGLGLDLIRTGALYTQKSDRRVVATCLLADHREHMRDMLKFKIQKLGVQPPPTKACIEVPFRGGTHPHGIRFKAIGVAKHLLHRHAIRLNLTEFGTPKEGFPVFQSILDEVCRQCLQLKAYHKAGLIQSTYDEIYCYLYPSTGRSPKTTVSHPTLDEVQEARDYRILENEREIFFDDLHNKGTQKERLQYLTKLSLGTAWADKDEGLSLQRQRAIKVMLGYIPKGNREIYAARGDVNIPAPFRASHPTSIQRWSYPVESNMEQASRGAATLGKRAAMGISEMHDSAETPENPTQLDRFYYKVQGAALELGEFKEALGLKDNRMKRPPLGDGFATLGASGPQETHGFAIK